MPIINLINCKYKSATEAYAFAPSMYNKSFTAGNMAVFEDLNVIQIGVDKTDLCWAKWLTI